MIGDGLRWDSVSAWAPDATVSGKRYVSPVAASLSTSRSAISAVASVAGGYGAALLAGRRRAATIVGIILLLIFLPIHYGLFTKFPLWYHLAFLASLPLLSIAGGALASRREETA